jgi:hypothetical protein
LIGLSIQVQTSVKSIPNCQVLRTSRGYTSTLLTEGRLYNFTQNRDSSLCSKPNY